MKPQTSFVASRDSTGHTGFRFRTLFRYLHATSRGPFASSIRVVGGCDAS